MLLTQVLIQCYDEICFNLGRKQNSNTEIVKFQMLSNYLLHTIVNDTFFKKMSFTGNFLVTTVFLEVPFFVDLV